MNRNFNRILALVLPNKKVNLFVIFVLILGIISGSIFLVILNKTDKELVINQITTFISNINNNNINNITAFKNALLGNSILIILIWILGMSIIGIIFNIFLIYFKGFITGFSISSFILVYKYKGLLLGLIYVLPTILINVLVVIRLGVYAIIVSINLWKMIFLKDKLFSTRLLKKYFLVFGISICLILISSLTEGFLVPALIKLIIKLFIK